MRVLLILLALLAFPAAAQARLSPEERRMIAAVDAEQERTIALLERLVNWNSGSLNLEGVRAVRQAGEGPGAVLRFVFAGPVAGRCDRLGVAPGVAHGRSSRRGERTT